MSHCMSTRAGIDACDNNINLEETIYICANCCRLVLRFELPVIIHNSLTDKWPLSAASDLRGSRLPLFCLAKLPNESLKAQIHINKP
jgi:hypothetical protein